MEGDVPGFRKNELSVPQYGQTARNKGYGFI